MNESISILERIQAQLDVLKEVWWPIRLKWPKRPPKPSPSAAEAPWG